MPADPGPVQVLPPGWTAPGRRPATARKIPPNQRTAHDRGVTYPLEPAARRPPASGSATAIAFPPETTPALRLGLSANDRGASRRIGPFPAMSGRIGPPGVQNRNTGRQGDPLRASLGCAFSRAALILIRQAVIECCGAIGVRIRRRRRWRRAYQLSYRDLDGSVAIKPASPNLGIIRLGHKRSNGGFRRTTGGWVGR